MSDADDSGDSDDSDDYEVLDPAAVEPEPFPESGLPHRKLTRALGCTDLRVNAVTLDPGAATTSHAHERQEELYVALDGGTVLVDGTPHEVPAGGLVRLGPEPVRSVRNDADEPRRWLMVGAPPVGEVEDFGEYVVPEE
jgi:uncharacterized cupin superfamily protein